MHNIVGAGNIGISDQAGRESTNQRINQPNKQRSKQAPDHSTLIAGTAIGDAMGGVAQFRLQHIKKKVAETLVMDHASGNPLPPSLVGFWWVGHIQMREGNLL